MMWGLLFLLAPLLGQAQSLNPQVTQENIHETICVPGWTKTVRPSSSWAAKTKLTLLKAQGLEFRDRAGYELDHIVPLGLGGAPKDLANLQLQPWEGDHGARKKDIVENRIHRAVCSGKLTLLQGRSCFGMKDHPNCPW